MYFAIRWWKADFSAVAAVMKSSHRSHPKVLSSHKGCENIEKISTRQGRLYFFLILYQANTIAGIWLIQNIFNLQITETCPVSLCPKVPLHRGCFYCLHLPLLYQTSSSTHKPSLVVWCSVSLSQANPNGNEEKSHKSQHFLVRVNTVSSWLWLFT